MLALLLLLLASAPAGADDLLAEAAATEQAADDVVHGLLAHALQGSVDGVAQDVARVRSLDAERRKAGLPATGLLDDALLLAAAVTPSRDARREALERTLAADPDPVIRRLAEHHRDEDDDGAAATQLLADDQHDRAASLLNDAVRPLGTFSPAHLLAAVNPLLLAGSVVDSIGTTALNLWHYNQLSSREREALARYQAQLERTPTTSDAPAMVHAVRRLSDKQARAACDETRDALRAALDQGALPDARFYAGQGEYLPDCTKRLAPDVARLDQAAAKEARIDEAGRWPVDDPLQPDAGEEREHRPMLHATALGDASRMSETASRFLVRHPESPLAPGARYVRAVARDLAGHRDAARTEVVAIARDHSNVGRHAAALVATPEWNRLDALAAAETQHSRDVAKYVLIGPGITERSVLYTATRAGVDAVGAAQSFGMLNLIGMVSRGIGAWRRDPASNQDIIDRGEDLLARDPDARDAAGVHARLADAYERAENYGRALMHLAAAGVPDPKRVEHLEGKLADTMLADADRHGGDRTLLAVVAHEFPLTAAGKKASERLAKLPPTGAVVVDRDLLTSKPMLAGPTGLDLPPGLLDGRLENGELADPGVTLSDGTMTLSLRDPHGGADRVETRTLDPDAFARASAAAETALHEQRMTASRATTEAGRFEKYIPVFLEGSIDESGLVSVYPGVKLRPYASPDAALYR